VAPIQPEPDALEPIEQVVVFKPPAPEAVGVPVGQSKVVARDEHCAARRVDAADEVSRLIKERCEVEGGGAGFRG